MKLVSNPAEENVNFRFDPKRVGKRENRTSWNRNMFNALGFGLASAVLLLIFGKLITDNWFSYLLVAIIQFELVMFWLGLKRPLGTENNDRYLDSLDNVDSNAEQFRHDASVVKSSRPTKKHSK